MPIRAPLSLAPGTPRCAVLAVFLLALLGLCMGGCGARPPGGGGTLQEATVTGGASHLVVHGTPYEMGWWQGHLLKARILHLHETWLPVLLAATAGGGTGGAVAVMRERLDLYVDQTRHRLPERLLQELDGLADGCGLSMDALLRTEVMRDALRMEGMSPRLGGAMAAARTEAGLEARAWWSGPDASILQAQWVAIERRPREGVPTLSVAWPGSLGALAAVRADGRAALAIEIEIPEQARMGFGSGWPFSIALRIALEESADLAEQMARSRGTVGHGLLVLDEPRSRGVVLGTQDASQAVVDVQVNVSGGLPRALDAADLLALGPYPDFHHPMAERLLKETTPTGDTATLSLAERIRAVHLHADGDPAPPRSDGPWIAIRFGTGKVMLDLNAPGAAGTRSLGLAGN